MGAAKVMSQLYKILALWKTLRALWNIVGKGFQIAL